MTISLPDFEFMEFCGNCELFRSLFNFLAATKKVRKMDTTLLKHLCYCQMLLMRTTKTVVCLQTKATFHHPYWFQMVFELNLMNNTLPIAQTRLLKYISTINSV